MTPSERDAMLQDIHTKLEVFCNDVAGHKRTLYGNGQPGLVSRVNVIETKQNECPARTAYKRDNKMFVVAVCSMLVTAGSFFWMVITRGS